MKKKNLGAPDYASVEDRRTPTTRAPRYADALTKPDYDSNTSNYSQKTDKYNAEKSYDISKSPGVQDSITMAMDAMSYKIGRVSRNLPDMSNYDQSQLLPSRKKK